MSCICFVDPPTAVENPVVAFAAAVASEDEEEEGEGEVAERVVVATLAVVSGVNLTIEFST